MCLIKYSFQLSAKNAAKRQPQKSKKKMIHKTKTHKQYRVIHFHYEALSREYQWLCKDSPRKSYGHGTAERALTDNDFAIEKWTIFPLLALSLFSLCVS